MAGDISDYNADCAEVAVRIDFVHGAAVHIIIAAYYSNLPLQYGWLFFEQRKQINRAQRVNL